MLAMEAGLSPTTIQELKTKNKLPNMKTKNNFTTTPAFDSSTELAECVRASVWTRYSACFTTNFGNSV